MTNSTTPARMLRLIDVTHLTGLSRSTIYRLQALGQFPKAVKLSARTVAWMADEIAQWLACRVAARDSFAPAACLG
jgi:prophage regulatory protein